MTIGYRWLLYDTVDDGSIAIITLNRPDKRNAQHRGLLVELDQAFTEAEADDAVKVVILRGAGAVFSSGHDMGSAECREEMAEGPNQHPTFRTYGGTRPGMEGPWLQEIHFYLRNTRRWRDLRKITVASVQGEVYAAGLMLMWACDLIVADETASFADVVGPRRGICGVEYFAHPWELGARKAKELLLTGDSITVEEAYRLGMVSKVFPRGRLEEDTLTFARRIARMPSMTALAIKEAVNQTQDIQGFHNALQASMTLHELNHAHWAVLSGGSSLTITPDLGGEAVGAFTPVMRAERGRPSEEQGVDS